MMEACKITALYSGSGGNAIHVRVRDTAILIDAGKSARALCRALCEIGEDIADVRAIFVTHEHSDHVSALEVLSKKYDFPIHIMEKSATRFDRLPPSLLHEHLVRHVGMFCETVGALTVSSFRTPHDSQMSVGYRIAFSDEDGEHLLGIATDIGYVSDSVRDGLCGCEAVVLESNHDVEMLMDGPYPYDLKLRIRSNRGHLSNADSASLAAYLAEHGTRAFLLAHLSEENNDPVLALDEATSAISDPSVSVSVAAPDRPTALVWREE
jgi:phosphoribosyl 1,2-cyclic phosphodiesterase